MFRARVVSMGACTRWLLPALTMGGESDKRVWVLTGVGDERVWVMSRAGC